MQQPPKDNNPQHPADEELESIRVTRKRRVEVAPVEGSFTSANAQRAPSKKKAKVEEKAPAKDLHQFDITTALQQIDSRIENLTNIVERGIKIYASMMGISPQAFTDDAVFDRETHRLAEEYNMAHQQNIRREESGGEAAKEKESEEDLKRTEEESEESDLDGLFSSPRRH